MLKTSGGVQARQFTSHVELTDALSHQIFLEGAAPGSLLWPWETERLYAHSDCFLHRCRHWLSCLITKFHFCSWAPNVTLYKLNFFGDSYIFEGLHATLFSVRASNLKNERKCDTLRNPQWEIGNWYCCVSSFLTLAIILHLDFAISKETLTQDSTSINNKLCSYV